VSWLVPGMRVRVKRDGPVGGGGPLYLAGDRGEILADGANSSQFMLVRFDANGHGRNLWVKTASIEVLTVVDLIGEVGAHPDPDPYDAEALGLL